LGNGYNTKGRGYPDVALIGHLYPIVNSGEVQYKDGTSASTPVMAGILSLVNAERLKLKKSSGKYFKRKRASITYMESTVVDISIPLPSSKPISLSLPRSPLSKTPKQVFF